MTLATTVALAVVRGPVPVAKTLGAIDRLSGGRLVVAVGPGSSPDDYAAVGLDFSERWPRFDEAIGALRALWRPDGAPFVGPLLLDRGSVVGTPARATVRTTDLGGELGLRRRASSGGPTRRRLAGVCLQHDAGAVRPSVASASLDSWPITGRIPTRSRTRWRRCGATSPTTAPKPTASSESG